MDSAAAALSEANPWRIALLRLLSRGHAIAAELQRIADALPPTLLGEGPDAARLLPVLPDFAVFRTEGAVHRVVTTPDLLELDEESRELHLEVVKRLFRVLAAIYKYHTDLKHFIRDLESGLYVSYNLESLLRSADGAQLLPEAMALLGTLLFLVDERLPGPARERALVLFYRCTLGTADESDSFRDICRAFQSTGRPAEAGLAARQAGYPENYFARLALPQEAVRQAIGVLQTGDVYNAARHYPPGEHRSHSLSSQAGLLYVILFFDVQTLTLDHVAMREIVNRHFGDAWVVAYALGFTADLLAMWAPYPAAQEALGAAITPSSMQRVKELHQERLRVAKRRLKDYLTEGALGEDVALQRSSDLLSCLRQANTSIRWLMLQPTTIDPRMKRIFDTSDAYKEQLLEVLVDTALLEERVKKLIEPLVARRHESWLQLKSSASQAMDDLALYFSGEHALRRNVRNEELERWFRGLQQRIDELGYTTQEDILALGRKVAQLSSALDEVQHFHEIARQLQIKHFLSDTKELLQRMVQTVNLSEDTLRTIATVADLSYAWKALGAYQSTMHGLLDKSTDSIKGLRALFLKLSSILEVPLQRIQQAQNESNAALVSEYYSSSLLEFMRSVLQEIPRLIFKLLSQIAEQHKARLPEPLPSRIEVCDLQSYADRSTESRRKVAALTQGIALLMRGIRETDVAVLGALRVQPQAILVEGLRRELVKNLESLLSDLRFTMAAKSPVRGDLMGPLEAVAARASTLRRAFERVQDYLGVCALQMWHSEMNRIVQFLLYMEEHWMLRGRVPPAASSRHHDPGAPIKFLATGTKEESGRSFISRVANAFTALSEPSTAQGGLHGEWLSPTGELLLDGLLFEKLHRAVGAPGVAAVSRILGFETASRIHKVLTSISTFMISDQGTALQQSVAKALGLGWGSDGIQAMRTAVQRVDRVSAVVIDSVASIGQRQLLRRRLHQVQRLHSKLDAPLLAEALSALDAASVSDSIVDTWKSQAAASQETPGQGAPDRQLLRFHRQIARAVELPGYTDPLRQVYRLVPAEAVPEALHMFLLVTVLANPVALSLRSQKAKQHKSNGSNGSAAAGRLESCIAFVVGLATIFQQLPCRQLQEFLKMMGAYMAMLCQECGEGKESWAEGALHLDMLGELLEVLGLPREALAESVPQGLLDLWPGE